MKFFCVSLLLLGLCSVAAAQSMPTEREAVSVKLLDVGEGTARKIQLSLSGKWSTLPEATRKHILEKLRALLPEEGLKAALLALSRGETEIEVPVGAGPNEPVRQAAGTAMVKLMPGMKIVTKGNIESGGVITLGDDDLREVEIEVLEGEEFEELPAEIREKLEAALKARHQAGQIRMRLGQPGEQVFRLKIRDADQAPGAPQAKVEHRRRVMVAPDHTWQQLPEDTRRQILDSLRESLPPEMMKEVLLGLARGHHRGMGSFREDRLRQHGPRRDFDGPRRRGRQARRPGPDQALVRALVALTHEVQALRREVASLRGEHPKTRPPVPVRVITSKDGRMMLGSVPKAPQRDKLPELESEMKDLRTEIKEIRSALESLMRELHRLQPK
jgi:hypothetical protein